MQQKNILIARRKALRIAVAAALPVFMMGGNVHAACTAGSTPATDANTVTCTEGSTYDNPSGTTVSNTAAISTAGATSSVVQMTGNGNIFTNAGTLINDSTYSNTGTNAGQKYGVYVGAGTPTLDIPNMMDNSGTISAAISDANMLTNKARLNTAAVVGLGTDAPGEYELDNSGTISATHNGVGRVNGVEAGGDVESMRIVNSGSIAGTQSHAITKTTSTATSFQGTVTLSDSSTTSAASIGVAAGIYAEEEVASLTVENSGTITGTGTYASGIYTRAAENAIINSGTISGTSIGVAQVPDSGEIRTMTLENRGTITGDVMSVNGSALRWWSLSHGEGTGGATLDSRLNINSQWGQADSTITNSGTIAGNFYYSNGTHVLTNEAGGIIAGNIDLDQRDTTCANCTTPGMGANTTGGTLGASSTWTVVGTKSFTFENAGTFNGNLTIRTASSHALGHTVASDVTLIPTVTGSGAGSSLVAPSSNIAGMGGTLNLITAAGGDQTNVTIKPKVAAGAVVKDGEFFKVANTYQINGVTVAAGAATLPNVASANSLISWTAAVNASGNLVLESEVGTANIAGLSSSATSALNAFLAFDSNLGSAIQNLGSDNEVRHAAEQLRPEINNAGFQAAMGVTDKVFGLVDTRLGETHLVQFTGKSGIATGDEALGKAIWMQGFGFRGDQDRRKSVDGYTADAYGFAIGADTLVGGGETRVGAAFSYGQSNIDDKGVNHGNKTDIDSYQATLYGSMLLSGWYLNGTLGLGKHNYDSKRIVLGNVVNGSHDAWQYTAKVDAGWPMKAGFATITPVAALTYSRLNEDSYTETGVGALAINSRDMDSFRSGLGAKALIPLHEGEVKAGLEVRATWNHEFADTAQDTTARFAAGGGSFSTSGVRPARDSANLGASLRLMHADKEVQQSLLLSYDAEVKDQYLSHTALLQARFDF